MHQRLLDCIVKCIHGLGADHDQSGDLVAGAFADDENRGTGEASGIRIFRILINFSQVPVALPVDRDSWTGPLRIFITCPDRLHSVWPVPPCGFRASAAVLFELALPQIERVDYRCRVEFIVVGPNSFGQQPCHQKECVSSKLMCYPLNQGKTLRVNGPGPRGAPEGRYSRIIIFWFICEQRKAIIGQTAVANGMHLHRGQGMATRDTVVYLMTA